MDASLGYDAIFKLRCSSGLRIKTYLPKTKSQGKMKDDGISDSPELFLSCIMPDTCITIELEHRIGGIPNALEENGRRSSDSIAYLQTALLYTTAFGNRRVRVTTLALKVAASIPTIFDSANFDSLTAFMTRQAISDIFDHGSLHLARLEILNRCVSILSKYRKHGEVQASPGKLVLAEALQLLPLFCLSLLKSRMFRSSLSRNSSSTCKPSPTADERAFHLWFSSNVSPAMSMLSVHPSLYELNNMASDVGEPVLLKARRNTQSGQTDVDGHFEQDEFDRSSCEPYIQLPPSTKPSVACMRPDGVYLLDDGFHFFLFVGRDVSIDARSEFLSFEEVSDTGQRHVSISTSSDFGSRIWNVISQLRKSYRCSTLERFERPLYSPVIVVIGSGGAGFRTVIDSALEEEMIESLVEDSSSDGKNYEEFLIDIFNRVRNATM